MASTEFIFVSFFLVIGSFILGVLTSWVFKDHLEAFIDNAAYSKSITHPEMLDEHGNVRQDELIYLTFGEQDDMMDYEDE